MWSIFLIKSSGRLYFILFICISLCLLYYKSHYTSLLHIKGFICSWGVIIIVEIKGEMIFFFVIFSPHSKVRSSEPKTKTVTSRAVSEFSWFAAVSMCIFVYGQMQNCVWSQNSQSIFKHFTDFNQLFYVSLIISNLNSNSSQ